MSQLEQDIDRIIADTDSRKLLWNRSSPTSFYSRKQTAGITAQFNLQKVTTTTVQKQPTGRAEVVATDNYIFQLSDVPGPIRLSIRTQEPEHELLRGKFRILFDKITQNADREGLDFLRKVIES